MKAGGLEAVGAKHEHPSVYTYYQLLSYAEHGTKARPFHPQMRARTNRDSCAPLKSVRRKELRPSALEPVS